MNNTTDAAARIANMNAGLGQTFDDITNDAGGHLRCESCRAELPVQSRYWRVGWPKCCGHTMRWWTARQVRDGEVPQ